ncbi:MAG: hypothetical protein CME65_05245 [Halobacteriovoraceae bacterium]|nr:hypothetical protein [Halobacteriovoraceae bacterium]|tara:strand:+ start:6154 stop:7743 length:1590 start_codon:yes stop_codon:yes gene_type:complete
MKNVTEYITRHAKNMPEKTAVSFKNKQINFLELNQRINKFCHSLTELGVKPKDKVLFFVKPNLDFAAITFALFRMGAVSVFIDPGMKREYFLKAIEEVDPDVLVGIPKVHILKLLKPKYFKNIRLSIQTGFFPGLGSRLYSAFKTASTEFETYRPDESDLAAILYTSGGTGSPKGVEYSHDIFINQTKMLRDAFHLSPEDIDIPGFPLFSFFSLAIGMRSHVPRLDASKPSAVNPEELYEDIQSSQASFLAGSPAIWSKLADYCLEKKLKLPTVKHVVMFGAPVDIKLHLKFSQLLSKGTTYTPYGATEALPVSCISGEEILKQHKSAFLEGEGICVGAPLRGVDLKIMRMNPNAVDNFDDWEELNSGEIGEIVVSSKNVTKNYYKNVDATSRAKIFDGQRIWHRMGDVGYLDSQGRLWFCGRQKHVVFDGKDYFFPAQIESVFNQHPKVLRSALVQNLETKKPLVIVQRRDRKEELDSMFLMDLKNLAQTHQVTKKIGQFVVKTDLPVDVRHNIKIDREQLSKDISYG